MEAVDRKESQDQLEPLVCKDQQDDKEHLENVVKTVDKDLLAKTDFLVVMVQMVLKENQVLMDHAVDLAQKESLDSVDRRDKREKAVQEVYKDDQALWQVLKGLVDQLDATDQAEQKETEDQVDQLVPVEPQDEATYQDAKETRAELDHEEEMACQDQRVHPDQLDLPVARESQDQWD